MIRCKCCDDPLTWVDLRLHQPDGSPEDLCGVCRGVVYNIDIAEEPEYRFQGLQCGVTSSKTSEY